MIILILGLNHAPEPVGIGPYTAEMARSLARAGHEVTVVCGKPYYPFWKVDAAYAGGGVRTSVEDGVRIVRLPIYVPVNPSGQQRLLHHASFATRAQSTMIAEAWRRRPDVIIGVAPSLISMTAARVTAKLFKAKLWLHVQDFEVEAAFATGLLNPAGLIGRAARRFERFSLSADRISTISPQMCAKLVERGIAADRVIEFRNWADINHIRPLEAASPFREEWGIEQSHVALYSGNMANKQGIEIIVEAARLLKSRSDLLFAICGSGPHRDRLVAAAVGLTNVRFFDLQPVARLSDLLGIATVHLLPQIAGAADLVLPSKLTNILASGRPVVATAEAGTGLAQEVEGCGVITAPGDTGAFASAIIDLIDDPLRCAMLGRSARTRAEDRWSQDRILGRFEAQLRSLVSQ